MVVPHQCRSNQRRLCSGLSGHVSRLALCFERAVRHRRLLVHSYALKAPHAVAQAKGSVRPMQCHRRQSGKQMVGCLRGEVRGAVNETRSETHLPCFSPRPGKQVQKPLGYLYRVENHRVANTPERLSSAMRASCKCTKRKEGDGATGQHARGKGKTAQRK